MLIFSCSLDSTFKQVKIQGALKTVAERYRLFNRFDSVLLLTQDTENFTRELVDLKHVPCASSRYKIVRTILSNNSILRWSYFSLSSFVWLLRNQGQINLLISENVDSPTPFLFSFMFKTPYIIHYHYDVSNQVGKINKRVFEGMLLLTLEKFCLKRATCVWATAPNLVKKAESFGAKHVSLIPNWVNFNQETKLPSQKVNVKTKIVFIGRLHPVKRVNLLIEAFDRFRKFHPNASLAIAGDGEERQRLETMVKNLKLSDSVEFLGFLDHNRVIELLAEADMLVLPSVLEGNPRVLIEAMMMKVPIIGTNVPGISDMIYHGATGHLINQVSPQYLALAMDYLVKNKIYAKQIAEQAFIFAKSHFSKEEVFKKIKDDIALVVPAYRTKISY